MKTFAAAGGGCASNLPVQSRDGDMISIRKSGITGIDWSKRGESINKWDLSLAEFVNAGLLCVQSPPKMLNEIIEEVTRLADTAYCILHDAIQKSNEGLTWHDFEPVRLQLAHPRSGCLLRIFRHQALSFQIRRS